MWRFANPKEDVQWLRSNAPDRATGFYLWGSIYVRRALWKGSIGAGSLRRSNARPEQG